MNLRNISKSFRKKHISKILLSVTLCASFFAGHITTVLADNLIPTWNSHGIVDFTGDGSVVFDSSDLNTIYQETINGRKSIAETLITKQPAWSGTIPVDGSSPYTQLTEAINKQISLPTSMSGGPLVPELQTHYQFTDESGDYEYSGTVPATPIRFAGRVLDGDSNPLTFSGAPLVYSDDISMGRYAYTPEGSLAIGSGKKENESYVAGAASTYTQLAQNLGYYSPAIDDSGNVTGATHSDTKRTNLYDSVNNESTLAEAIAKDNVSYAGKLSLLNPTQIYDKYLDSYDSTEPYGAIYTTKASSIPYTGTTNYAEETFDYNMVSYLGQNYSRVTTDNFIVALQRVHVAGSGEYDGCEQVLKGWSYNPTTGVLTITMRYSKFRGIYPYAFDIAIYFIGSNDGDLQAGQPSLNTSDNMGRVWHKYVSDTGYCTDHIRQTLDISDYNTMFVSYTYENLGNGCEFYITIDGVERDINNSTIDITDATTLNLCTRSSNGNGSWACRYDFTAYFNCIILD